MDAARLSRPGRWSWLVPASFGWTFLSKHHLPDDDTLDPATHQSWLVDIARVDSTIDTPRHLFWGGLDPDADDSPTVEVALVSWERAEPDAVEKAAVEVSDDSDDSDTPQPAAEAEDEAAPIPADRRGRRRKLRRPLLVGAAATACALTVLAGTLSAQSKHVTLVVDGRTQYVDTRANTVDGVLAAAGLSVGAHDTLAPAGSASISDGSTILLDHGQQLTLMVDGRSEQIWATKTKAAAVEQAAAQDVEAAVGGAGTSSTSIAAAASPVMVTIRDGGSLRSTVSTSAPTVRALLIERKITLGSHDLVRPALDAHVTAGQTVVIQRAGQPKTPAAASPPAVAVAPKPAVKVTPKPPVRSKAAATSALATQSAASSAAAANAALATVTIKDPNRETTNARVIYEFFRDNGATAAGAAGITGNFIDESSTDPNAVSDAGFYGIEQWGGSRWDGPDSLNAFAADQGTSVYDITTQLDFSLFELGLRPWTDKAGSTHTPPAWVTPGGVVIKDTSITDPAAAALQFEQAAEGCEPADSCGLDVRQLAAQEVYEAFKSYVPTGPNAGPIG